MKRPIQTVIAVVIILLVTAQTSYAYIDPGTGSMAMMAILGIVSALGYTGRKYIYKIRGFFKSKNADSEPAESNPTEKQD